MIPFGRRRARWWYPANISAIEEEVVLQTGSDYFLKTSRLGFRLWSMDDLPLAVSLCGDARVTRLIGGPFSQQQIQERIAREIVTMEMHRVQFWPVFLLAGGSFMGCCGFRPHKLEEQIYELGYAFLEPYWGKGFAMESASAVIAHARDTLGAKGFFAGHHPENLASRRVLEKLGFHFSHRELYPPTGAMHPCYSLDFNSQPAPAPG
jgi:ribosomal-protein-alanine N-acetyltransferase